MDHILQFGISIDDDAIIKAVKAKAEKEITELIKTKVENSLFGDRYYYRSSTDPHAVFTQLAKDMFNDFLNENKEDIISRASMHLADKLARSKAGRAILEDIPLEQVYKLLGKEIKIIK